MDVIDAHRERVGRGWCIVLVGTAPSTRHAMRDLRESLHVDRDNEILVLRSQQGPDVTCVEWLDEEDVITVGSILAAIRRDPQLVWVVEPEETALADIADLVATHHDCVISVSPGRDSVVGRLASMPRTLTVSLDGMREAG